MTRFTFTRQFTLAAAASLVALVAAACGNGVAARGGAARDAELPALAQPIVSRVIGRDMPSLAAAAVKGGFRMSNERQRLVASFSRRGVVVRSADGGWFGLALRGVGDGAAIEPTPTVAPRASRNLVLYTRGRLTEWYANGPLGLEQGFTLRSAPSRRSGGPFTLAFALSGSLRPSLGAEGLTLINRHASLRYTLPLASDAAGRRLRAWLQLRRHTLLLRVDDRDARYPVRIDPFVRQATLHASDAVRGSFGFHFGAAVAASGDTIAVGAPDAGIGTGGPEGAVYVFTKPSTGWADATETAKLTASGGGSSDQLGASVAISGDTIVAGAPGALLNDHQFQGAVYVFAKPAGGWTNATQTARLSASDGATDDTLGFSIGISGDTIVAGAVGASVGGHTHQGAAYVFTKPAGGWTNGTETAKLTASDGLAEDGLGGGVAISGQTVVTSGGDAAYVFVEPESGWSAASHQQAKLTAAGENLDAVAIDASTIVAGGNSAQPDTSAGVAEVFVEPPSGWANAGPTAALAPLDARTDAGFGFSVAVQGDTVLIGAPFASPGTFEAGATYVYQKPASGWANQFARAAFVEPSPGQGDQLGFSVAVVDGSTLLAGAPTATFDNVPQGVAYLFTGSQTPPPPPPDATITSPPDGARYIQGQAATAAYACTDGSGGPGIATCTGTVSNGGPIDTSTIGSHTFTVTATSRDGESVTVVHHYMVSPRFTPPPTTQPSPPPPTTIPRPPAPAPSPIPCLRGDAKYPDFPAGLGVSPDYSLTDPTPQPDGTLEQTVSFGLTGQAGAMYATTGGCWLYQGHVAGNALNGYSEHQEFDTYGQVNLNGVILSPLNRAGNGGGGPALLHVGTDGGIYATGDDTRYDVDVISAGGSRLTIGLVDFGSSPWRWDGRLTSLIGQFGPASDGPCPFGRPIAGGTVTAAGVGGTTVTAYVQLPPVFSSSPDGGPPPTSNLNYGPYSNPDAPSATPGGGGGGSGGNLGAGNCVQTHTPCGHSLEAADASAAACESGSGLGATPAPAGTPGVPAGRPGRRSLHLTVPELYLGPLRLSNVFLNYDPVKDVWSGGGDAQVGDFELNAAPPPPDNGLGLHSDGSFDHGGASLSDPAGVPLFPGVDLTELGVSFARDPVRFTGDGTISVAGGLATVHGGVLAVFANSSYPYTYQPFALPGVQKLQTDTQSNPITSTAIGLAGTVALHLPVVGETDLANGYVFYIAKSYFEFGGHFSYGIVGLSIDGDVSGALDTSTRRFSLAGDLNGCIDFPDPVGHQCIGLTGAVSSVGFGACGQFTVVHTFAVGFRYLYSGGLTIFLDGCDLGPVQVDVRAPRATGAHVATPVGFDLPPGLPSTSVTVTGAGDAPRVAIIGPRGERVVGDANGRAVDSGRFVILPMRALHETLIGIEHPAGGRWTIAAVPGSVPITGVSHADGLPPARVSAAVRRHGARWLLSYRVRPRDGQTVTFAERAGQVFHVLGNAHGARGTLAFSPADAATRRRQIVALISLSGVQAQTLIAGRYTAPPRRRAGAVRRLRLSRHGSAVTASWARAADARGYVITVALSDGQVLSLSTPATQHALTVRAPVRGLGIRVRVVALGPDGDAGPARSARLAAPAPPARVTGVTATRTAVGVIVRWHRVRGALRYLVQIVVQGRRGARYAELSALPRLRPSRDLLALRPGRRVTITVRAMDANGKLGPAGTAVYRAARH